MQDRHETKTILLVDMHEALTLALLASPTGGLIGSRI